MHWLDWLVVLAFLCGVMGLGMWYARRASRSMADFFVADRKIPWWLAGTSMLATSFASDTPLHTTRAIREGGLAAAWFYWNGIIGGLIVAFVFAKLWRRAGVVTDNELIELRYSGNRAAVLRGGLALFKSLVLEILTMAWITLGMTKIVKSILGLSSSVAIPGFGEVPSEILVVACLVTLAVAFSIASGFWGVISTDIVEFSVAMTGAIILAVVALQKVGGVAGLREGLQKHGGTSDAMSFWPDVGNDGVSPFAFAVYLGVMWWANSQIDGSGQRAQRFLACKDERDAVAAGVWNMAVQYVLRSWPWYVTALASLILYPQVTDSEAVYPQMVADLMPLGLKGLMVASFFAAFMGTMEAHYNLTASYAVNDVYKRFVAPGRDERHYVRASRWMTLVVAVLAGVGALLLPSVLGAFRFKMELIAGVGLVYVLRWLYWRVNASTEIAALLASVVTAVFLNNWSVTAGGGAHQSSVRLVGVVIVSALVALVVTFLTRPEPQEHLDAFYRRVRPPRLLWGPVANRVGALPDSGLGGWHVLTQIGVSAVFVFSGMLGLGQLVLGDPAVAAGLLALAAVTGVLTVRTVFYGRSQGAQIQVVPPGHEPNLQNSSAQGQ